MPVDLNDSYEALYQRAIQQMATGNADQAIASLRRIVDRLTRLRPETVQRKERLQAILDTAWESLIQFLRWDGQHGQAIDVCKQVIDHLADPQAAQNRIGSLMIDRGDVQEGLAWLEERASEDPGVDTWVDLGTEYRSLERYDEAISCYRSALELAADNAEAALANMGLFRAYREAGRVQDALSAWSMVVVLDPEGIDYVSEVYTWLIERGDLEQAIKYLTRDPDIVRRTLYEGIVAWQRQDEQTARSKWRRVLSMDPEQESVDAAAWLQAAIRLGDAEAALDTGYHLLEHSPALSTEANILMGIGHAMHGEIDEAQDWFDLVIARLQRQWPSQNQIDTGYWKLLTSVVPDETTIQSVAGYFKRE